MRRPDNNDEEAAVHLLLYNLKQLMEAAGIPAGFAIQERRRCLVAVVCAEADEFLALRSEGVTTRLPEVTDGPQLNHVQNSLAADALHQAAPRLRLLQNRHRKGDAATAAHTPFHRCHRLAALTLAKEFVETKR